MIEETVNEEIKQGIQKYFETNESDYIRYRYLAATAKANRLETRKQRQNLKILHGEVK